MAIIIKVVNYFTEKETIERIRIAVFQEEQGVDPELEFDGEDAQADHLLAYWQDQAVGTSRIRYLNSQQVKIERLAVLKSARGQGIGLKLMGFAVNFIESNHQYQQIIIHAQEYIKSLYEKLGFRTAGEPFDEAGILHVKMIKDLPRTSQ